EVDDRDRVPVRGLPRAAVPVLHPRRGRSRAGRSQHRAVPRPPADVRRPRAVHRRHPPEAHDGGRRHPLRRLDGRRRRIEGRVPAPAARLRRARGGRAGRVVAPTLSFASAAAWEAWLEEHHGEPDGIWIKIAKKGSGIAGVRYPEVLESALCFGWIDGRREALDEQHFLQRFTPRRSRSRWSRINRDTAERLIAEGRMRPAGLAEVERAKEDGRWQAAYESQK